MKTTADIADDYYNKMHVAVSYAFAKGRAAITSPERAPQQARRAVRASLRDVLPPVLSEIVSAAGASYAPPVQLLRAAAPKDKKDFKFDPKNVDAVAWVKEHALELADGISDVTRKRIKEALVTSFSGGGKRNLLKEVRNLVGDNDRAKLIAHHESMLAANNGLRQSWKQAKQQGFLTGEEKRQWIAALNCCPICADLDGSISDFSGHFPEPGGDGPPQHVSCRCTEGLTLDNE